MKNTIATPKKQLFVTLISAFVFVLILSQRHAGFLIIFFAIPFVVWVLYTLHIAVKNPILRKWNFYRIVTWCVAFLLVFTIHLHYYQVTREYGNRVAELILEYKRIHGTYPVEIEQVGIRKADLRSNLGMGSYSLNENKPSLFYAVTYIAFDVYSYNFEIQDWEYKS